MGAGIIQHTGGMHTPHSLNLRQWSYHIENRSAATVAVDVSVQQRLMAVCTAATSGSVGSGCF